jgi:hypothetical protein
MKDISKHFPHYLPLLGLFAFGVLAFVIASYDRVFQMGVAIALAVAYVAWGIVHHYIHRDLYLSVVIEYIVVACLGLVIVFSLVFRT